MTLLGTDFGVISFNDVICKTERRDHSRGSRELKQMDKKWPESSKSLDDILVYYDVLEVWKRILHKF